MNTQISHIATAIIIGLFGGASAAALAEPIETQNSAYHLAAQLGAEPVHAGQAGPAGPSEILGRGRAMLAEVPYETMYSAFHMAERAAASPSGQAGRAGPVSLGTPAERSQVLETQFSAYDLTGHP